MTQLKTVFTQQGMPLNDVCVGEVFALVEDQGRPYLKLDPNDAFLDASQVQEANHEALALDLQHFRLSLINDADKVSVTLLDAKLYLTR